MVSRSRTGFTINIIDTPGLIEGGYINDQALEIIKQYVTFQISLIFNIFESCFWIIFLILSFHWSDLGVLVVVCVVSF